MGVGMSCYKESVMTLDKQYYIGEFSDLTGISKRMLRHYDKMGIFCPIHLNEENGYRSYSASQLDDLNRIQYLKAMGFTLAHIKDLLSQPVSLSDFLEILKEKEVALNQESDEIKTSLMLTKRTIMQLENQTPKIFSSIDKLLDLEGRMIMTNNKMEMIDLAQVMNRDLFIEKIEEVLTKDQGDDYHFVTFDIDHFMHVNDLDGYDVGDAVILHVVSAVSHVMDHLIEKNPKENFLTRFGGDEVSIFLKNVDDLKVVEAINQVFESIRMFDYKTLGCQRPITVSCGLASGKKPEHIAKLKDLSIKALMEAKRNGRDRHFTITY